MFARTAFRAIPRLSRSYSTAPPKGPQRNDTPWLVASALIFAPTFFYLTQPTLSKAASHPSAIHEPEPETEPAAEEPATATPVAKPSILTPALIIVMGTSGCGKSSIGLNIAQEFKAPFVDGDDLHPASNVAKMSGGTPLNDEDRIPWLIKIRNTALAIATAPDSLPPSESRIHETTLGFVKDDARAENDSRRLVVIGCSGLKVAYRDLLRGRMVEGWGGAGNEDELETYFLYLHGTRTLLLNRMEARPGHFFKAPMLDSQLATLQPPNADEEPNIAWIHLGKGEEEVEERGLQAVTDSAVEQVRKWGLAA